MFRKWGAAHELLLSGRVRTVFHRGGQGSPTRSITNADEQAHRCLKNSLQSGFPKNVS